MSRIEYWAAMIVVWLVGFGAAYLIGYYSTGPIDSKIALVQVSMAVAQIVVGYQRLTSAGYHGGWSILTPFILATIIIGILGDRKR